MNPNEIKQLQPFQTQLYFILFIVLAVFGKVMVDVFKSVFDFIQKKRNGETAEVSGNGAAAECLGDDCPLVPFLEDAASTIDEIVKQVGGIAGQVDEIERRQKNLYEMHNKRDSDGTLTWHNKQSVEDKIEATSLAIQLHGENLREVKAEVRALATSVQTIVNKLEGVSSEIMNGLRNFSDALHALERAMGV